MEKILNKIKNLLDLSNNNPNENEAIAAALKAQELMAKYDIEIDQVDDQDSQSREIVEEIYRSTGKHEMKKWKYYLAKIVSENFRCKHYLIGRSDIVFYGYKEDAKIALQVFTYLYTMGNKFAVRYYNKIKKEGGNTKGIMNTYLLGFKDGVKSVLEKQCTALMIVTPKEVEDNFKERTKSFGSFSAALKISKNNGAYDSGKADGKDIAKARALEATA